MNRLCGSALASVAVVVGAMCGTASAAIVEVREVGSGGLVGQELRLVGEPSEQSSHRVEPAASGYRVTGNGNSPVRSGAGCSDTSPGGGAEREVTCKGSNVIRSRFVLGNLTDLLFASRMDIQVTAFGGDGRDQLTGGKRSDELSGGPDVDKLTGGPGGDRFAGGTGADLIEAGTGDDRAVGGEGSDNMTGDAGADELFGSGGNDFLDGSGGSDRLLGGSGDDRILSSIGGGIVSLDGTADFIDCGSGDDRLLADRKDEYVRCERVSVE